MSMIKIENLTFSYPTSYDNVFENVSFQVDTDWKLGFVGRNGRGKTTFLNLLLGKYEYSGKILSSVQFDYFPYPVSDKSAKSERRKNSMTELKSRIHDKSNGLDYVLVGDYYVPDLKLPEEHRPIGMWGRLHRTYLEQYRPTRFSALCLSGELHTYLADLDEQATERCSLIIEQMKQAEGVTETMKADNQMLWVQSMNSIRNRAEEIIRQEMIYC